MGSDGRAVKLLAGGLIISIHAPRVGSDAGAIAAIVALAKFQSTLPVWGATLMVTDCKAHGVISIHAPRVGRDRKSAE